MNKEKVPKSIDDLARYVLNSMKKVKTPNSDTHVDFIEGYVTHSIEVLEYIDKKYKTDYTSQINIEKVVI